MAESVEVALRIRPLAEYEEAKGSRNILEVYSDLNQVRISNTDRAFTFNYVYNYNSEQLSVFDTCVKDKIQQLFKGYNLTILAYGQTGSGKTYTMGTAYNGEENMGIIPRVLKKIFELCKDHFLYSIKISVSFLELYQETAYDLLTEKSRDQCVVDIREDNKGIVIPRLTEITVGSAAEALKYLTKGSLGRATASTNMNAQSSRSHAIYTVNIFMEHKQESGSNKTAKFHLVDLAGSERSKKTGATGQTFREGININKGLLVLGNVIAALSDGNNSHIPYRDSNLTRLLKDSLGGNSITLMIACVSPADYNLDETLSTLRYADRARRIKNKPVINEDPRMAEIHKLNKIIKDLKLQLLTNMPGSTETVQTSELERNVLEKQIDHYKNECRDRLTQLSAVLNEKAFLLEKHLNTQRINERFKELKETYGDTLNKINLDLDEDSDCLLKTYVPKLEYIKEKFVEIDEGIKENENEFHNLSSSNSRNNSLVDLDTANEISERQEYHTKQQIQINKELQQITEELVMKERLAHQIAIENNYVIDIKAMAEHEAKISQLEKEKDDLLQQLRNTTTSGSDSKTCELRSKRVKELEERISDLKKKVQEQARLIKLKEKDEQKIKQLNSDILSLKQTKVRLVKSMRQESEKFRTWKIQREKEVTKLKEQNRKKESQIVKMETAHSRQQNVLKRKMEEVNAVNKRLKEALNVRKTAQENKFPGKLHKLEQWLKEELNEFVSIMEAQANLPVLLEYRGDLQELANSLRKESDDTSRLQKIEEEIELRSIQIADLQQKIINADEGSKDKRWDKIQSIGEAKCALKMLLELVGETIKREYSLKHDRITQQSGVAEANAELLEAKYKLELELHEKNVLIQKLEAEKEECQRKKEDYRERLSLISHKCSSKDAASSSASPSTPDPKNEADQTYDIIPGTPQRLNITDEELTDMWDNLKNDPDWRKTPLAKRIQKLKASQNERSRPIKRNSEGGCTCKKNCSFKNCGCRKVSKRCSSSCKCNEATCVNRTENAENLPQVSSSTIEDDSTSDSRDEKKFLMPEYVPKKRKKFLREENE